MTVWSTVVFHPEVCTMFFMEQHMNTPVKLVYVDNEHSQFWLQQKEWAEHILSKPDTVYPSGKHSHDCAHSVYDRAMLELIEDLAIQVTA